MVPFNVKGGRGTSTYIEHLKTSWWISLSKNQVLVCYYNTSTLSKTTTGIIVQWKLIT